MKKSSTDWMPPHIRSRPILGRLSYAMHLVTLPILVVGLVGWAIINRHPLRPVWEDTAHATVTLTKAVFLPWAEPHSNTEFKNDDHCP